MYDFPLPSLRPLDDTFKIYTPPPRLTGTQWADANFYLSRESSASPGRYDSSRTPYITGILDELTNPLTRMITIRAPRQMVKTTVILITIARAIDIEPCPMLLVEPTLDLAMRVSRRRIAPMIRDVPALAEKFGQAKSRDGNNTILDKNFPGGSLTIAGSNSASGLISEPRRIVMFDEIDFYEVGEGPVGDPIETGLNCAATFFDWKAIFTSTPTVDKHSAIDDRIAESDDRHYLVPCHNCDTEQRLEFGQVKFDSSSPAAAARSAGYACIHCGILWTDAQRIDNMTRGHWRPSKEFSNHAGFSLLGPYNCLRPLGELARKFVLANHALKQGNKTPYRSWMNNDLGKSWQIDAKKSDPQPLYDRRENYSSSNIPWRVLYLTAGVDVQDDRLEIEIVGWRAANRDDTPESWGIEDIIIYRGRPDHDDASATIGADFRQLDEVFKREWTTQDGRKLRINAAAIDSGGHRTEEVYRFCNNRIGRNIFAIKGSDGPRPIWPRRAGQSRKYKGSLVWTVGVDTAKDAIYSAIAVADPGPGYAHFPISYQLEYFQQLTSEEVRTRYKNGKPILYWYLPPGVRNEALDRRAYALAALHSKLVPWEYLLKGAPSEPPEVIEEGQPPVFPERKPEEPKKPFERKVRARIRR